MVGGLACLAASGAAQADDAAVTVLDQAQFLAALETGDPRFEGLAASVAAAAAEVGAEGVRPNPSLSLDREEVFPEGGGVATQYARLSLPLDVSGRRGRRIGAARTATAAAAAEADAGRVALVIEGLRVFEEAAHARLQVELARSERTTLVRLVEVVRKRAGAGAASGYDLQRFEQELAAYDDLIVSAETRLLEARAQLAMLVGGRDELIDAASTLALPAPPAPLDQAMPEILDGRSDYRAAKLRVRSADQRAGVARRGWIPDLVLSGGFLSSDLGDETAIGYTVGLGVALPVLDRGGALGARARAARRTAEAEARILEVRVPATVRTRHAVLERRIAQANQLATAQLSRLDDLLRAAETGYREGASSVVELLDAHRTARDTRVRDLELRRDARLAELDLLLALGRRP